MNKVEFNEHPIRTTLTGFLDLQKTKEFIERGQLLNATQLSQRDYVFSVVRQVRSLLESADVNLVSRSGIGGLNDQLNRALSELNLFHTNADPTHIHNALSHAEDAIRSVTWVLPPKAGNRGRHTIDEIAAISAAANAAMARAAADSSSIAALATEFRSQVAALESRMSEMQNEIKVSVSAANASLISVEARNSAQEASFNQKFSDLSQSFQTTFDFTKERKEKIADFYIGKLKESEESARRIVQVVGNIGTTGNYSNLAISEGKQANLWRNITLGLFGIGIALAGGTLFAHIYEEFTNTAYKPDTLSLLLRFLVALVIALPAFYTARESARHRTNSDRSKQTELELATLEPFMEFLPLDQKHAIKAKLTDRYFGNQVDTHKFDSPLAAGDALKLVGAFNELVKKLKE